MTLRQKKLAETIGNSRTLEEAAIKAGYAPSTAHQQNSITKSKGWIKMLNKKLPDKRLLKKHNELLDKKEYIAIGKAGEREVIATGEIDANAVAKGLDMAYKLKGKYLEPDTGGNTLQVAVIIND